MIRPLDPLAVPLAGTSLIEASAGTGKTYTITTLFVRLLLELDLDLDQILVVTFTRAATAELRDRVRRRLREVLDLLDGGDPGPDQVLATLLEQRQAVGQLDRDRRRLGSALRTLDDAAIFTIHGFCQRMLHENAFESGVEFDTELVTDLGPLVATCVHDFWASRVYALPLPAVRHMLATARRKNGVTRETLHQLAFKVMARHDLPVLPERHAAPAALESEVDLDAFLRFLELELVAFVRKELPVRKAEAGLQSYDDLLVSLRDALRRDQGGALAARIADRYRAALIDEFQDTDPVQYEIFRTLYHQRGAPLFLIGDPKQAIYSFRGADVFAYMSAIGDAAAGRYTLSTNHRSDAPLVQGLNTLFARVRTPFLFDQIGFSTVGAHWQEPRLELEGRGPKALEILFLPRARFVGARSKHITLGKVERALPRLVAAQISRLLRAGATIEGAPLGPGDVAVLCRKNREAALVQQALRELGVPSVLQAEASVLDTPEAADMERIARALAEPEQVGALKAALCTRTLGTSLLGLRALQDDVAAFNERVARFRDWSDAWRRQGFVQAFRRMLADEGVEARLLEHGDGERSLTNLLHLAELMQSAAAAGHLGPHALCHWLERVRRERALRAEAVGESAQIRLESDARAVKLVTIHKAKGLEYPVVYCPYLWSGRLLIGKAERWLEFHDRDDGNRLKLDIGSERQDQHLRWTKLEAMSERMRLMYVALTRARHRCSFVWGGFNEAGTSPLAYALHQSGSGSGEQLMGATERRFKQIKDDDQLLAELQALVDAASGTVELTVLDPDDRGELYRQPAAPAAGLQARALERRPAAGWSVASFTALTAAETGVQHPAAEGLDRDPELSPAAAELAVGPSAAGAAPGDAGGPALLLGGARRGIAFGLHLHKVLELLDFQADRADIERLLHVLAARARGDMGPVDLLASAVVHVLETTLEQVGPGFCLRRLARAQRLNEMEFHLSVAPGEPGSPARWRAVSSADIAAQLSAHAAPPQVRGYADRLAALGFPHLTGFLKGVVDLIFEHQGRWFVVDYKSNFLGAHADDYAPARLHDAMALHHYYLQYHLYALAVHRYLAQRQKGYDYSEHFGGVLYLFVRGMSPGAAAGSGVFFDRPSPALVHGLDALLGRGGDGAHGGQR